jgi:hypothetical protein
MNTAVIEEETPATRARGPRVSRDVWLYLLFVALIGLAWGISQAGLFKAGDDISYWMAVIGGSMMAILLLYPARKYIRVMRNLGRVKWWFWMHMMFGLFGPWLILVHSTFRIGSLNAGVALFSMVIVVISGVVGRFIYVRVHRGLNGEKTTLRELQARAGMVEDQARSRLAFAPEVEARLLAFEKRTLEVSPGPLNALIQVCSLPLRQWTARRACEAELEAPLQALAAAGHWSDESLAEHRRLARKLVSRYLETVCRVAQFTAYERVFALWHVAHLPFVFLLGASAVVHVVAVHAY